MAAGSSLLVDQAGGGHRHIPALHHTPQAALSLPSISSRCCRSQGRIQSRGRDGGSIPVSLIPGGAAGGQL